MEDEGLFEKFTSRIDVVVKTIHSCEGNGSICGSMVYYEDTQELAESERVKLNWIKEKALSLALDIKYGVLTNNKQRQFYLLETYGYNSIDALDIVEYLAMMKKTAEGK
jgi:hypothetical protein